MRVSLAQERLWLIRRLHLAARETYVPPFRLSLLGKLDVTALSYALAQVMTRHESLRTRFTLHDGIPHQWIDPAGASHLRTMDCSGLHPEARDNQVGEVYEREGRAYMDLADGPLFRATLLKAAAEEHVLLIKVHHIIFDGWSLSVLLRELGVMYASLTQNASVAPLAELPVQYADYAIWQRQMLRGARFEAQLAYWQQRLALSGVLQLPLDRPRTRALAGCKAASLVGARHPLKCSSALYVRLQDVARRERVTLYMLLLAAFDVVLFQWTGQTDIALAAPVAGRTHRKTEGLIGFFLNIVIIRADLSGDPTFRDLLAQVRQLTLDAYAHQDVPFERLIVRLPLPRPADCHPIAQVQFIFQNTPPATLQLPGMVTHLVLPERRSTRFDLTLELAQESQCLSGHLGYRADLFDAGTIDGLVRRFFTVLELVVEDPQRRLAALTALGPCKADSLARSSHAAESR